MNRLISWLSEHKAFTVIASAVYFAAVVRFHEEVSKVSVWLQEMLSLRLYNRTISISGIFLTISLTIFFLAKIKNGDRKASKIFYLVFTALLIVASFNTLLVVNVESIHYPQYAVLTLPVFAFTMSFGETILIVTLLGAIDEANQFFILHNWKYMDFNDVILNLLGAAAGIMIIFILFDGKSAKPSYRPRRLVKSPFLAMTFAFLALCVFLYFKGILSLRAGADSRALIVLNNNPLPDKFWISFAWGKTYHILTPVEGVIVAAALIACYAVMDYIIRSSPEKGHK